MEERAVAEVTLISRALDEIGRVQWRRDNSQDGTMRTTEWEIAAVDLCKLRRTVIFVFCDYLCFKNLKLCQHVNYNLHSLLLTLISFLLF